jgi:hypothetical protein
MKDSPFYLQVLYTYFLNDCVSVMANLNDYNGITNLEEAQDCILEHSRACSPRLQSWKAQSNFIKMQAIFPRRRLHQELAAFSKTE